MLSKESQHVSTCHISLQNSMRWLGAIMHCSLPKTEAHETTASTTELPKHTSAPCNLQHVLRLLPKLHFLKFKVTRFPTRSLVLVMVKVHHRLSPSLEIWLLRHGGTQRTPSQETTTSKVAQTMSRRIKSSKTCHWNLRKNYKSCFSIFFFVIFNYPLTTLTPPLKKAQVSCFLLTLAFNLCCVSHAMNSWQWITPSWSESAAWNKAWAFFVGTPICLKTSPNWMGDSTQIYRESRSQQDIPTQTWELVFLGQKHEKCTTTTTKGIVFFGSPNKKWN